MAVRPPGSIAALQVQFRQWLETGDPDAAKPFGAEAGPGLAVYLNNYRAQLLDCLEQVFPCTLAWLGEERFRAAGRQHIMQRPPVDWTLDAYPATFVAALAEQLPDDVVAAELASLERALDDAFTAADLPPLTRAMFTALDWEQVALTHAAGGTILSHRSNAAAIWKALDQGAEPPAAQIRADAANILVWRSELVAWFRQLDPDEALVMAALDGAVPFTAMCSVLEQELGEDAAVARAGQLLARWADDGAVSVAA